MRSTTVPAKITPPNLGNYLRREGIFSKLDKDRDKSIVWICGPAGCGKTMLAASYLKERDMSAVWYQVDSRDSDIGNLFHYLVLSLESISSATSRPLPAFSADSIQNLPGFAHNFFEKFYGCLTTPFTLVFDNYQNAPEDGLFQKVIHESMSVLPRNIRLLIVSRNEPGHELARKQIHRQMTRLGWEDMRLTRNEIREMAKIQISKNLDDSAVDRLDQVINGWAAGLILLLHQPENRSFRHKTFDPLTFQTMFDYFAGEVLGATDEATRDFLVKSSFLTYISPDTAGELTGRDDASEILEELARRNYFTYQIWVDGAVQYQYHPLFRTFLRQKAWQKLPVDIYSELQHHTAKILMANHQNEEAADLLRDMKCWEELSKLIKMHAASLVDQGRLATLEGWLAALPRTIVDKDPWLLYWLGGCRLPFDPEESLVYYQKAYKQFRDKNVRKGILTAWCGAVDSIFFRHSNLKHLDYYINTMDDGWQNGLWENLPLNITTRVTAGMLQAMLWRQPDNPRIHEWADHTLDLWTRINDISLRLSVGIHIVLYYDWMGKFHEGEAFMKQLIILARMEEGLPFNRLVCFGVGIYHCAYQGDTETGWEYYAEARNLIDSYGMSDTVDCLVMNAAAYLALGDDDRGKASDLLDRLGALTADWSNDLNISYFHSFLGWHANLSDDHESAIRYGQNSVKLTAEFGAPLLETLFRFNLILTLYTSGMEKEALDNLAVMKKQSKRIGSHWLDFSSHIIQAYIHLKSERRDEGIKVLTHAMRLGRKYGIANVHGWHPRVMAYLCGKALQAGIEIGFVREMIQKRGLICYESPFEVKHWPWYMEIFTFGRFELKIQGKSVVLKKIGSGKPLDLIKTIIAFGENDVHRETISDAMWPDSPGDADYIVFRSTLHRLRKKLGRDDIIIFKNHLVSLNPDLCWTDIRALEGILDRVENIDPDAETADEKLTDLLKQMLMIYQGPFLDGDSAPWVMAPRDRLRSRFTRCMKVIGGFLEARRQWHQAVNVYEKGIEIDPLAEDFYQFTIRCYSAQGRRAEAIRTYQRCVDILNSSLGIPPSPQTRALHRTLLTKC